jgi:hypothetical protein
MRERVITSDEALQGPMHITECLKRAGFKFDRDRCPVQIRSPFAIEHLPDGSTLFKQWDLQ